MSVGAISTNSVYAGIPGAASLGLATPPPLATPPATTPTTPPATTPPPTTPPPASTGSTIAGFSVLGIQGNGKPTNPPPAPTTTPDPYHQAYDGITTAANNYLISSLGQGPTNIPIYAGGTTANAFAGLNDTLAAIKTGLAAGLFQGSGFNELA